MKHNVTLKYVQPGKWEIIGHPFNQPYRIFAVLINHRPRVYEVQFESGHLAYADGFQSLAHVRAHFNQ